MKLRFDKNSIRLRVKKSDLERLSEMNSIQEKIYFPDGCFDYRLSISEDKKEVTAKMNERSVEVVIPLGIAMHWMNHDETGIYHTIHFGNEQSLDVIIEKDFPCKDRFNEDQSDSFIELSEKNQSTQC